MLQSCRRFMEQLIDYAGLFPPAALPLETSIRNYAAYRNDKDAWMLGRFIIPAQQLDELEPYIWMFSRERPLWLSVLGKRSRQPEECIALLGESLQQIESARNMYGDFVRIDVLELPLPPVGIDNRLLNDIALGASKHELQTFCELTFSLHDGWESSMMAALDTITAYNAANRERQLGVKLRTGGVTADAFPSPRQVASVIVGCRDRNLPMKFTAGLHHPVRMYRQEVNADMHGFLNVFFAGLLAHAVNLDVSKTEEILADENPDNFFFTENSLGWKELAIDAAVVTTLRNRALFSYGSCSFDEPRNELRELKSLE